MYVQSIGLSKIDGFRACKKVRRRRRRRGNVRVSDGQRTSAGNDALLRMVEEADATNSKMAMMTKEKEGSRKAKKRKGRKGKGSREEKRLALVWVRAERKKGKGRKETGRRAEERKSVGRKKGK